MFFLHRCSNVPILRQPFLFPAVQFLWMFARCFERRDVSKQQKFVEPLDTSFRHCKTMPRTGPAVEDERVTVLSKCPLANDAVFCASTIELHIVPESFWQSDLHNTRWPRATGSLFPQTKRARARNSFSPTENLFPSASTRQSHTILSENVAVFSNRQTLPRSDAVVAPIAHPSHFPLLRHHLHDGANHL